MKTFEIKISGSGTFNQIKASLYSIAKDLVNDTEEEAFWGCTGKTYEDDVIYAEIKEE